MSGILQVDALWEPLLKQDENGNILQKSCSFKASWYFSHNLLCFFQTSVTA